MTVLGIDSATPTASVALIEDGRLIAEEIYPNHSRENRSQTKTRRLDHSEILIPLIASVIERAQCSVADLSGIAVSIGPGSFTGLRIGLSTVKGLAYGWNIPVCGVSTLSANAARVTVTEGLICSLLDARKQQVYVSIFRRNGESLVRVTEEMVTSVEAAAGLAYSAAAGAPCLFIGDGVSKYHEVLANIFGNELRCSEGGPYPSIAAAAARLAEPELRLADAAFLARLAPVYLRATEAKTNRGESV
jgi:tRNA threonylcarbamoyladenosine biosynthesis protein TsaB